MRERTFLIGLPASRSVKRIFCVKTEVGAGGAGGERGLRELGRVGGELRHRGAGGGQHPCKVNSD